MKVSEHLNQLHKMSKAHHDSMIEAHQGAMEKSDKAATGDQAFHKASIQAHQAASDYHGEAMEECSKALTASDLAKQQRLVPDNIRGVIPNFPGVVAVPRAGQRELPAQSEVPLEFEKLVSIED